MGALVERLQQEMSMLKSQLLASDEREKVYMADL